MDTRCNNPGTAHLAFYVDDADAFYARLLEQGVRTCSPPYTATQPPLEGLRRFYFLDGDGFTLEAIQRPLRVPEPLPSGGERGRE